MRYVWKKQIYWGRKQISIRTGGENGINYKWAQENFWDNVNVLKLGRGWWLYNSYVFIYNYLIFSYLVDRLIYDI